MLYKLPAYAMCQSLTLARMLVVRCRRVKEGRIGGNGRMKVWSLLRREKSRKANLLWRTCLSTVGQIYYKYSDREWIRYYQNRIPTHCKRSFYYNNNLMRNSIFRLCAVVECIHSLALHPLAAEHLMKRRLYSFGADYTYCLHIRGYF